MGNGQTHQQEVLRTGGTLFVTSVEASFISEKMIQTMLSRWEDIGKPLFLSPKEFKERILTNQYESEVKLNYLKWLTQGLEIDMFEILSILILYSRTSLDSKLQLLFNLYCFEGEKHMQVDEFQFMMDKFSTSIGSTLQLKKTLLLEIVTHYNFLGDNSLDVFDRSQGGDDQVTPKKQNENKIVPGKDKMTAEEFVSFMKPAFAELSRILNDVTDRINLMSLGVKQATIPNYIQPG